MLYEIVSVTLGKKVDELLESIINHIVVVVIFVIIAWLIVYFFRLNKLYRENLKVPRNITTQNVSGDFISLIEVYFYFTNKLKNSFSEIIFILSLFFRNSSAFISFLERTSAPKISNCRGARTSISVSSVTKFCILAPFSIASSIASSLFIEHNVPVNTTFLPFRLFIVICLFTSYMTSTRGHVLHTLRQGLICLLVVSTCLLEMCRLRILDWLLWC